MQNGTMIQYFHWYYPADGSLWNRVNEEAEHLSTSGINAVWLPPAYKGTAGNKTAGYDVYDLYDLGEFDQKGSVRTKYGTKQQYIDAVKALHKYHIQAYADIVVNHMGGGDETELIQVVKMDPENRNHPLSEPFDIEAFTKFTFPVRNGKYSTFVWDYTCFSGVDYDQKTGETGVYNILNHYGHDFEEMITDEKGNYDYLMYSDIEFRNPAVRDELKKWGLWFYNTTGIDGFRLDAVKHIAPQFYNEWLAYMRAETGKELFAVGEYWAPGKLPLLEKYIEATEGKMSIFDAALHHSLHAAAKAGNDFDLTKIFDNSLVNSIPHLAVTVTDNHDTQPLQALEAPVDPWFKPIAYALILLRDKGYPCIFYPDLYGAEYTDKGGDGKEYTIFLPKVECLPELLTLRKEVAYGAQHDYFDYPNCVGWTREGVEDRPESGCAVVISNGDRGYKKMFIGAQHSGKIFKDSLNKIMQMVTIDANGEAEFFCQAGSVSVWVGA